MNSQATTVRVALVTSGLQLGGGVPNVVRWLRAGLESTGVYSVDVYDLATSAADEMSRRLARPSSWIRPSLRCRVDADGFVEHWGANAVEIEVMRYRPRRELSAALRRYDLIQVVAGGAALAGVALRAGVPVALQVATRVSWERNLGIAGTPTASRAWRRGMNYLTTKIEDHTLRAVDAVLVENDDMLAYVSSLNQRTVIKAPPGVDTDRFTPHPQGWRSDGYLLSVCRLGDPRKGLARIVRGYYEMVQQDSSVANLVLAGKGRLSNEVVGLIRDAGLEGRVQVLSDVESDALADLYQGASVYLQASYEEGLGLSVLEAMATGLPVVATSTAGSKESVVHGRTGWLIPQSPRTDWVARGLASRVQSILDEQDETMSLEARRRCVAEFSSSVAFARFSRMYGRILPGRT